MTKGRASPTGGAGQTHWFQLENPYQYEDERVALTLRWRDQTPTAFEARELDPGKLRDRETPEIARTLFQVGKSRVELGDLFQLAGSAEDGCLIVEGDLNGVDRLGEGMTGGELIVRGGVGHELGVEMAGGRILVEGDAGDWAGAGMRGGQLRIKGSAGRFVGAALPGSRLGMREGVILVDGSIGEDAGLAMRRGLIAFGASAGDGLGRGLVAGSIFGFGPAGRYLGAGMKRGTLALFGSKRDDPGLLPTFISSGRSRPPFLTLYLRKLKGWGFPVPDSAFSGSLERYNGDLAEGGQGEIWVEPTPS